MYTGIISTQLLKRLLRLAATGIICLLFGMNTHLEARSTSIAIPAPMVSSAVNDSGTNVVQIQNTAQNVQVLSSDDEDLYRTIFAAQAKQDWPTADAAIGQLDDQTLMGHVLADRYARRPASALELKVWLVAYTHLPEADDIYDQVRGMPSAKGMKISKPDVGDMWSGGDSYSASFGFRTDKADKHAPASRKFLAKVSHALHRGDPYAAENTLYAELDHRAIPSDELSDAQGRIAAGFFYAGAMQQAQQISNQALSSHNPLALWIAGLTAWKDNNVLAAADDFTKLAAQPNLSPSDKAAAEFWAWRALSKNGETAKANIMLDDAAKQPRSFYGMLAASLTGNTMGWSWDLPALSARNLGVLEKSPVGHRALALIQIGQLSLAESELRHLNPQGRRDMQNAMLALAENDHMPSLALQLGGIATGENGKRYDAALYPVPPWKPEQGFRVDRALIYALMRRESFFDPTAVSDRGACGLMQLMPETANLMAKHKVASRRDCSGRMLEPSYNMALGQEYLRRLSQQPMIGNNLLFLLAAYNGGPGKLSHWTDEQTLNDPLLFIESLPIHETRDYVQQVLMHYWTYRARLDESVASMAQLAHGGWPRYALRDETLPSQSLKTAMATGFTVASSLER